MARSVQVWLIAAALAVVVPLSAAQRYGLRYGCNQGVPCCYVANDWTGCPICPANAPQACRLYGCEGELWMPESRTTRLTDWSYAGYMYGDYNPPRLPVTVDIRQAFDAVGDGVADDTAAFQAAIQTIEDKGCIYLPPGTYRITQRLDITKRIFFRGAGAGQSIIFFPQSLQAIYGNTYARGVSNYAFGPGFINWNGGDFPDSRTFLATVTAAAPRGADIVTVSTVAPFYVGQRVRIVLDNINSDLLADLNNRLVPALSDYNNRTDVIRWTSAITEVLTNPPRIRFERNLPFNVSTTWRPEIHEWNIRGYGVKRNFTGVADLTIRFPASAWPGESRETGQNALYFFHTAHSWVQNVVFENTDLGIAVDGGSFMTIQNVTFTSTRPHNATVPWTGSYGIWLKGTFDCLIRDFVFNTDLRYEMAVSYFSVGNAFVNGRGIDLDLEMLYGVPYGNLFTNINFGRATSPFGWVIRGQDASAYNTFWNLRSDATTPLVLPPISWAPSSNFVMAGNANSTNGTGFTAGNWFLETNPNMWPPNLYDSMRKLRNRPLTVVLPVRHSGPGYNCTPTGARCCTPGNATCPTCPSNFVTPSSLFGCTGELWKPASRPSQSMRVGWDWSFAGYMNGSSPIPSLNATVNVRSFGAKGDGVTDDTLAVLWALGNMTRGVLYFPAGRYRITGVMNIRKHILIKGDGRLRTTLWYPKSLTDLYGNTWTEGKWVGTSQYSHGTGFINFGGWDPTGRPFTIMAGVTRDFNIGATNLTLNTTAGITRGQWVRILQSDPGDGSLMQHINGGSLWVADALHGYPDPCRFMSRVNAVGPNWIDLERPLPYNLRAAWKPTVHRFMPMLNDRVGVEGLSMEFAFTKYPGHFLEQGYNGIHFNQVANGWIRDVDVINSDMGYYFWGTAFCQMDNVRLSDKGGSRGFWSGHRGVWLEHGNDNMLSNFNWGVRMVHDISLSGTEQGAVIINGTGIDINLDHHRSSPFSNLFTNLNLGWGSRAFAASGDEDLGTHSGAYSTFWNIQAALNILLPDEVDFGSNMTFVGMETTDTMDSPYDWYVELLSRVFPSNLFNGMRNTRTQRLSGL